MTRMRTGSRVSARALVTYIDEHYDVIYRSKQSYYDLFTTAGIRWKKTQKVNPKMDLELVAQKRQEIRAFLAQNQAEIEAEQMVVQSEQFDRTSD
jgi:transposase